MSTVNKSGWTGWAVFAGVILLISAIFTIVQALVALIGPNAYYVLAGGSLWILDVAGWGWWNLIIGVLLLLTALALLSGRTWARIVAVILLILNMVSQLLLVPAQPWWSLIMIAIDIVVIYAIVVHGRELREDA